jgi:hypothetical protein
MEGKLIRTVGQTRADFEMAMALGCYDIDCAACLKVAGIEAF